MCTYYVHAERWRHSYCRWKFSTEGVIVDRPAQGGRNHRWWQWRGVARGQSIKCGDNGAGHAIRVWTPLWLYFLSLLYTFYCDVIPFPYTHTARTHTLTHTHTHTHTHEYENLTRIYIYKHITHAYASTLPRA